MIPSALLFVMMSAAVATDDCAGDSCFKDDMEDGFFQRRMRGDAVSSKDLDDEAVQESLEREISSSNSSCDALHQSWKRNVGNVNCVSHLETRCENAPGCNDDRCARRCASDKCRIKHCRAVTDETMCNNHPTNFCLWDGGECTSTINAWAEYVCSADVDGHVKKNEACARMQNPCRQACAYPPLGDSSHCDSVAFDEYFKCRRMLRRTCKNTANVAYCSTLPQIATDLQTDYQTRVNNKHDICKSHHNDADCDGDSECAWDEAKGKCFKTFVCRSKGVDSCETVPDEKDQDDFTYCRVSHNTDKGYRFCEFDFTKTQNQKKTCTDNGCAYNGGTCGMATPAPTPLATPAPTGSPHDYYGGGGNDENCADHKHKSICRKAGMSKKKTFDTYQCAGECTAHMCCQSCKHVYKQDDCEDYSNGCEWQYGKCVAK